MEKHIIFGATGFIGSHVLEALLKAGKTVTAVVRVGSGTQYIQSLGANIHVQDSFDKNALSDIMEGYAFVYNCTANVHPHQSLEQYRSVQVELSESIARASAAANCKRLIQLSSVEVYGDFATYSMDETYVCRPLFDLQRSLLEREQIVKQVAKETGLDVVMLRPAGTYGKRSLVLDFFLSAHKKGGFPIIGNGNNKSSAIDTRDIGRAMLFLAHKKEAAGQVYNLQGYQLSMCELKNGLDRIFVRSSKAQILPISIARLLAKLLYKIVPFDKEPMITPFVVHNSNTSLLVDDSKIRVLGFETQYRFEQTLEQIVQADIPVNASYVNYA